MHSPQGPSFCLYNNEIGEGFTDPEQVPGSYSMNLIKKYYQNKFRNEFLDQKIIDSDIFDDLGGVIVKVLCCFASEVMISEMVRLPRNGSLRAIQ